MFHVPCSIFKFTTNPQQNIATMVATADTIECVCCGNIWDGNAQCYCMCVGCPSCTPETAQPEPEPSNKATPASKALKRVFGRLHETDKVQSSGIKKAQKRLDILEKRCQKLEAWIGREVAKKAA